MLNAPIRGTILLSLLPLICGLSFFNSMSSADEWSSLPQLPDVPEPPMADWLLDNQAFSAHVYRSSQQDEIHLSNGLVTRTFRLSPNGATVALDNLVTNESILRAVKPEATLVIDGITCQIGGLADQPNQAYLLPEWLDNMKSPKGAWKFKQFSVSKPVARFAWKRVRHHESNAKWPPAGTHLRMDYRLEDSPGQDRLRDVRVSVHYELYDGIPVFCKWLTVHNLSATPITVDHFIAEHLAVVEHTNWVEARAGVALPKPQSLHVETDFAFGGFNSENAQRHIVHWRTDDDYATQVNYLKQTPCLLQVEPDYGPAQTIQPGASFETCRAFELVYDSTERERRALARRRMYRVIAPWVTENPLMHHMRIAKPEAVRTAIDHAAEVGFEMIILSFGSGFDMENDTPAYLNRWREIAKYAQQKNVEIGSYSLLSSRRIGNGNDIVCPEGLTPTHGNCPALTSDWGREYFQKLYRFFPSTDFTLLEHDGSYPGDVDVTQRPPLQKGEADSRWVQWRIITDFYQWCRANGIYLNVPDYYFLAGSNKCGMGYREVNWSLPRAMQVIHTRQNIFDGSWSKTPSMGWMFVPLSQYHGGGSAATIEPLKDHLPHYQKMLQSNLGFGVQACYRGPRLYDAPETRALIRNEVAWFKTYRDILESDLIHGRRADGRDLDWMLHVNPKLATRGMLLVHNPLPRAVSKTLKVDLYYTGCPDTPRLLEHDKRPVEIQSFDGRHAWVSVQVDAESMNWYVVR